ncbi:isocitrate lyase/phosphoenolpyruvate mutase family protein [Streptomyces albidoflavus]
MTTAHAAHVRLFRSLHTPSAPLALANAWDAASARVVEAAGAPAVATTSAGVAWALGSVDGNSLDRDRALAALAQVTAAVTVPVTADLEDGYGAGPAEVGATVTRALAAGVAGINLEDGTRIPADFATRLTAADETGTDLFLNARIDTYLLGLGAPEHRLTETLTRAHRYVAAGADGIFVPGVTDPATISVLAAEIPVPLNVMAGPGAPSVAELGRLGVARVSLGSGVAQAAYGVAGRAARELLAGGTYDALAEAVPYPEMQGLLAAR